MCTSFTLVLTPVIFSRIQCGTHHSPPPLYHRLLKAEGRRHCCDAMNVIQVFKKHLHFKHIQRNLLAPLIHRNMYAIA